MNQHSQEQQAQQLWQDYQTGNEAEFWQQYEILLSSQKSKRKKATKIKRKEPDTKSYIPCLLENLSYLIAKLLLACFFYLLVFTNSDLHPLGMALMSIFIMFLTLWAIENIAYLLPYITITKSGIYVKQKIFRKPLFFKWESLKYIKLIQEPKLPNQPYRYSLHIYTHDNQIHQTLKEGYQLSKSEHHQFTQDLHKRGVIFN